jgi:hypothetical protein
MKDWFKIKRYPHIGLPLTDKDRNWVEKYVKDQGKIAEHAFFPFIHREVVTRKFRKEYDSLTDEKLNSGKRNSSTKKRQIYYANHLDSNIYSYYSQLLNTLYEVELKKRHIENVVIAYRNLKHPQKNRGMNNVDFAQEVFSFVKANTNDRLSAITFDIKNFFDNLDHDLIMKEWKKLLECDYLPRDHYNVYKNITKFSYVDIYDLFEEFKNELLIRKNNSIESICVSKLKYMRNKEIVAFCRLKEFNSRIRKKNLIKSNKKELQQDGTLIPRKKGVPQGSPISALLANLYLIEFDSKINDLITERGGLYRRYSDDIVVVCNSADRDFFRSQVLDGIKLYNLEIQEKKTNTFLFRRDENGYSCFKELVSGTLNTNKRFSYLGFEFDGTYVYLKSGSLSKYYRNMKHAIARGAFYAKHTNYKQDKGKIFRRRLYKRFSYIGAKRKMIWVYDGHKWIKQHKHDWGNFLTYANMAHFNIRDSKIDHQISRHWVKLNKIIKEKEDLVRI